MALREATATLVVTLPVELVKRFDRWRARTHRPVVLSGALALWLELTHDERVERIQRYVDFEGERSDGGSGARFGDLKRSASFTVPVDLLRSMEVLGAGRRSREFRTHVGSAMLWAVEMPGELRDSNGEYDANGWCRWPIQDTLDAVERWRNSSGFACIMERVMGEPVAIPDSEVPVEMDTWRQLADLRVWFIRHGIDVVYVPEAPVVNGRRTSGALMPGRRVVHLWADSPYGVKLKDLRLLQPHVMQRLRRLEDMTEDQDDDGEGWKEGA